VLISHLAWVFIACSALAGVFYCLVLIRAVSDLFRAPRVRDGLAVAPPPGGWPPVTVVVPAHDEERVIESCVASLLASDYPDLEIVVVLDRCSDRTREFLIPFAERDPRLRVIENAECPLDWAGKCNAARIGAEAARGRYLLFTDADVRFHPSLVRAAMGLLLRDRRGLFSLLPRLVADSWYERIVQPIAAMMLVQMYPIAKVNRERRRRPFANGQFLLFDRKVYERIGGHAATRNDLLEDIAFARLVEAAGARGGLALGEDMLEVHMYSSFPALHEGWKRIFIEASRRRVRRLRRNARILFLLGIGMPAAQIGALLAGAAAGGTTLYWAAGVVAWGLAIQGAALALVFRASGTPLGGIALSPLGAALVARILWDGAADLENRRPVRWGGRDYRLAPED